MTTSPLTERDIWLGLELRHLAALSAIAEERSFRRAAERLGYVQSAVSQQIAFLERLVGVRLIERSRGPTRVTLTHAGELLLAHAAEILGRLEAARADLDALSERPVAVVQIGLDLGTSRRALAPILRVLARTHPGIRLTPVEVTDQQARLEAVSTGGLDLAFVELPVIADERVQARELWREPWLLLLPPGGPHAQSPSTVIELQSATLIPGSAKFTMGEDGVTVEPATIAHRDAVAMVAAGIGAAVLPALGVHATAPGIGIVDLSHLVAPRTFGLCWRRDRMSGPIRAVIEVAARQTYVRLARLVGRATSSPAAHGRAPMHPSPLDAGVFDRSAHG